MTVAIAIKTIAVLLAVAIGILALVLEIKHRDKDDGKR